MSRTSSIQQPTNAYERVGRLASLGIEEPWQTALYFPSSYVDCTYSDTPAWDLPHGEKHNIHLTMIRPATPVYGRGAPRLKLAVEDADGQTYQATIFGETKAWQDKLHVGKQLLFVVSTKPYQDRLFLTIHDVLPNEWAGKIIPVYPAQKKVIEPDVLRGMILRWLPNSIPIAAQHVTKLLEELAPVQHLLARIGATGWSLDQLLLQCHCPSEERYIQPARMALMRLAALSSLHQAGASAKGVERQANPIRLGHIERCMLSMPFMLTGDQSSAIRQIASEIASPVAPCRHIVAGDVGVGKSCVISVIAAATAAEPGRRVMMLFPTTLLASQHFDDFAKWFPGVRATLVTGETGGSEDLDAQVLIGTSALLHRKVAAPDVLMIDEQHKWSRAQREQYLSPSTHLIELSATCIPRTVALMRFGHVSLSQMRQTHRKKTIHTEIWEGSSRARDLTSEITTAVSEGHPVFIIYPQREKSDAGDPRHNVQEAWKRWEQLFPGKVRSLTSDNDANEMTSALEAITSGEASILICTTVVEVGVNVGNLRHIVVVNPERHGLTALHQLRGRVARQGGEGWFHMLSPQGLPAKSRARLDVLVNTTDGFIVAEEDLRLRGAGDLRANSTRQSGSDGNFLFGQKIDLEIYDQMAGIHADLVNR